MLGRPARLIICSGHGAPGRQGLGGVGMAAWDTGHTRTAGTRQRPGRAQALGAELTNVHWPPFSPPPPPDEGTSRTTSPLPSAGLAMIR